MTTPLSDRFPLPRDATFQLNAVQTRLLNQYYRYCLHTRRVEHPQDLTPSAVLTMLLCCAVHADRDFSAWVRTEASVVPRTPPGAYTTSRAHHTGEE